MKHADLVGAASSAAGGLGLALWLHNVQQAAAPVDWVRAVAVAALAAYLALTRGQARRATKMIAGGCALAIAVLLATGSPLASLYGGADFALMFMGFLPAITLIRAAFEAGPLLGALGERLEARNGRARSDSVMVLSHVTGAVMTLGALGVVAPILARVNDPDERRAAASVCLRGMSLAILWTPFTVGMGFAGSHLPGVPLWQAMGCGAVLAALGLMASLRDGAGGDALGRTLTSVRPAVVPVLVAAALLIGANALTGLSTLKLIILGAPILSLGYIAARAPASLRRIGARLYGELGRLGNDMLLFTASITMGATLSANPRFAAALADLGLAALSPPMIVGAMVLLAIGCALLGLHVTVTATIAFAIASGLDGALSELALFTVILYAWTVGAMLSLSSLGVAAAARAFDVPAWRLIYGPNLVFCAGLGAALTLAVGALEWAAGA
jgi:hypothetical protein